MPKTNLSIAGDSFLINGAPVYAELPKSNPQAHGLLFNARFIQGIYDDANGPERYARWGRGAWDPERNTDDLIAALSAWYAHGLRAFTVGLQGGGPCFTIPNNTIDNNPYGEDGRSLDPAYAARLDRLLRGADAIGMVVIVSLFYQGQYMRLRDARAVRDATITASRFLREGGYTNVLIEIANEHRGYREHPILATSEGMALLLDLARAESGGLPVGSSDALLPPATREEVDAADFILFHGNGLTRQQHANAVAKARAIDPSKPVICNEDSQRVDKLDVALATHSSWGYYSNMTKQEPPTDWGITPGEDTFFARRTARCVGIALPELPEEERYYLQGLEPEAVYESQRWIRLASLEPESIDRVAFFRDGVPVGTVWDAPHSLGWQNNWRQSAWPTEPGEHTWLARATLRDGRTIERSVTAQNA